MMQAGETLAVPSLQLTPMRQMRKKKPFCSPITQRQLEWQRALRAVTVPSEMKPEVKDDIDVNLEGSSLVFKEFSYRGVDGTYGSLGTKQLRSLLAYMCKQYGLNEIFESGVFLYLTCTGVAPPSNLRPFTVAGCIAVWLSNNDSYPFNLFPPDFAEGDDLNIPDHLANDLNSYNLPEFETLAELAVLEHGCPGARRVGAES